MLILFAITMGYVLSLIFMRIHYLTKIYRLQDEAYNFNRELLSIRDKYFNLLDAYNKKNKQEKARRQ